MNTVWVFLVYVCMSIISHENGTRTPPWPPKWAINAAIQELKLVSFFQWIINMTKTLEISDPWSYHKVSLFLRVEMRPKITCSVHLNLCYASELDYENILAILILFDHILHSVHQEAIQLAIFRGEIRNREGSSLLSIKVVSDLGLARRLARPFTAEWIFKGYVSQI